MVQDVFCRTRMTTLMLVTDVGDEMCWLQLWDDGDCFNALKSPFCHHHEVISVTLSPTSL